MNQLSRQSSVPFSLLWRGKASRSELVSPEIRRAKERCVGKEWVNRGMHFWTPDKKTASAKGQMNIELETGLTATVSLCPIQNR